MNRVASQTVTYAIDLLTPIQVAKLTGLSLETLAQWRSQKRHIPYLKVGRRVRYTLRDIEEYLEGCRVAVSQTRSSNGFQSR
jgi:excisionase family DNA binding protein